MPVRRVNQRPSTCYSSNQNNTNSKGTRQNQAAWMAFHRQRAIGQQSRVTSQQRMFADTPMSWPGAIRPPAGLGSLEAGYRQHRLISSAQPQPRTRLPPLNNSQNDPARRSHHNNTSSEQKKENQGFSARKWANNRPNQIYNASLDTVTRREMNFQNPQEFKRAFPVPRQKRRENTVLRLGEREAATLRRLQGIYANTKEKTLRSERIQNTLKNLQNRTIHREMSDSLREYQKRAEIDKGRRLELKRVRDNYHKNKQRRDSHSHVSLNALETPQVSRHAYGLPEEGQEFQVTHLAHKTEERLQGIWKKAIRRAIVIDKLLNTNSTKVQDNIHLPKIVVKRSPLGKVKKEQEVASPSQPPKATNYTEAMEVEMADIDAISLVSGSDDDLTDILEED